MGYIHDTNMLVFIPPEVSQVSDPSATWTDGVSSNVWHKARSTAASTFTLKIPILLPHHSSATNRGAYLKSIVLWYRIATAAATSLACVIQKVTLPADGAAFGAAAAQTFTYDSGHDDAAERIDVDEHKMTLTITTPFWVTTEDQVYIELTAQAGATVVFWYHGARAAYTLRI